MKVSIVTTLFFSLFFLSGCSISSGEFSRVPDKRIYAKAMLVGKLGHGQVTIKRNGDFAGSICSRKVYIDSLAIADINVNEELVIYPPVGTFTFGTEPNGICADKPLKLEVEIVEDHPIILRIGANGVHGGSYLVNSKF